MVGCVSHRFKAREIVAEYFVVGVVRVLFDSAHDHIWSNEASDVVDMSVSVVADNALAQPQHLCDSEIIFQNLFDLASTELGISIWIEQALLCRKHAARAIDLDRSAFKYYTRRKALQLET